MEKVHSQFVNQISQKEVDEINESLAEFFFGCNIPFRVVDSVYFKNFAKKLRVAYANHIPERKLLSPKLLDNEYEKLLTVGKSSISSESVLLIDGWKNSSSTTKTVVSMKFTTRMEKKHF